MWQRLVNTSIARRLALFYMLTMFLILAVVGLVLNESLRYSLISDVKTRLVSNVHIISSLLTDAPLSLKILRQEIVIEPMASTSEKVRNYSQLMDVSGAIILSTPRINKVFSKKKLEKAFKSAKEDSEKEFRTFYHEGSGVILLTKKITTKNGSVYYLQTLENFHHQLELLEHFQAILSWVIAISMLISFIIGIALARNSIHPIKKITKRLQSVSAHDLQGHLDEKGWPKELRPLVAAYNCMCKRLESSFNRLNQFSADLAHELRTPINNIIGQTEVSLSSPRKNIVYQEVLSSNLEEFQRLSRMIKELLFLAQAENPKMHLQLSDRSVRPLIEDVFDFYSALAEEKSIFINCHGQARLKIDPKLFRHAMTNIISNAINYSHPGGKITTHIQQVNNKVTILIQDSGIGIAKEDLPKLLDRFYRADRARQQHQGGSGLGLSIVATIIALHNAKITITSELNQGTCVTLTFCTA